MDFNPNNMNYIKFQYKKIEKLNMVIEKQKLDIIRLERKIYELNLKLKSYL